ncbi:hypothetical protein CRN70_29155 (plasmid) [Klebsiella pneumoniae]|nr:hypothetical protein CRN70_29155 [Klebsiella pneumoniae]
MVPADLLETLLTTAEQALWHREWTARDCNHPVPESVTRRLADAAKVRALLKNEINTPPGRRVLTRSEEPIMQETTTLNALLCAVRAI